MVSTFCDAAVVNISQVSTSGMEHQNSIDEKSDFFQNISKIIRRLVSYECYEANKFKNLKRYSTMMIVYNRHYCQ